MLAELMELRVAGIFDEGLHEFLARFIDEIAELSGQVQSSYLRGSAA